MANDLPAPDALWQIKFIHSKDGLEMEAWALNPKSGKAHKLGAITERIALRNAEIREAWTSLMGRAAAEAVADILDVDSALIAVVRDHGTKQ